MPGLAMRDLNGALAVKKPVMEATRVWMPAGSVSVQTMTLPLKITVSVMENANLNAIMSNCGVQVLLPIEALVLLQGFN
ncbi:hypothetical protein ACJ72_02867 [Emergomyces africanus]|uniref:Uncharacterized protein n=1 Tax=Emergomyces africanus TaxID=1955775 RepID=A0A1B7P179_9EURO|nr:hypothetical protein ACJ72_02867 [Emergomyces africanus]